MNARKLTAAYRIIADGGGNRYRFFCDLSGAVVCTTRPVRGKTPPEELMMAWEEARHQFNQCESCGSWVCDAMYNADVLECVECAPWEERIELTRLQNMEAAGFGPGVMRKLKVCTHCGAVVDHRWLLCKECGRLLPKQTMYQQYMEHHRCW